MLSVSWFVASSQRGSRLWRKTLARLHTLAPRSYPLFTCVRVCWSERYAERKQKREREREERYYIVRSYSTGGNSVGTVGGICPTGGGGKIGRWWGKKWGLLHAGSHAGCVTVDRIGIRSRSQLLSDVHGGMFSRSSALRFSDFVSPFHLAVVSRTRFRSFALRTLSAPLASRFSQSAITVVANVLSSSFSS